jgi:hypothetical protein
MHTHAPCTSFLPRYLSPFHFPVGDEEPRGEVDACTPCASSLFRYVIRSWGIGWYVATGRGGGCARRPRRNRRFLRGRCPARLALLNLMLCLLIQPRAARERLKDKNLDAMQRRVGGSALMLAVRGSHFGCREVSWDLYTPLSTLPLSLSRGTLGARFGYLQVSTNGQSRPTLTGCIASHRLARHQHARRPCSREPARQDGRSPRCAPCC